MDNKTLNTDELQELKAFISSRGFKDDLVQNEILDHFASKVEEVLTKDHTTSLQDAMYKAHQSFGALGFYVIQANLEKNTISRYRKLYWQSLKSVLASFPHMLLALISGWLIYKGCAWAYAHNYTHLAGENDFSLALWVLMLCSIIGLGYKFEMYKKANYYIKTGGQVGWWAIPGISMLIICHPTTARGFAIAPVITAAACTLYIILFIAQYRLLQAATRDYEEFKRVASE